MDQKCVCETYLFMDLFYIYTYRYPFVCALKCMWGVIYLYFIKLHLWILIFAFINTVLTPYLYAFICFTNWSFELSFLQYCNKENKMFLMSFHCHHWTFQHIWTNVKTTLVKEQYNKETTSWEETLIYNIVTLWLSA